MPDIVRVWCILHGDSDGEGPVGSCANNISLSPAGLAFCIAPHRGHVVRQSDAVLYPTAGKQQEPPGGKVRLLPAPHFYRPHFGRNMAMQFSWPYPVSRHILAHKFILGPLQHSLRKRVSFDHVIISRTNHQN
jgi:hypothetical protein